MSASYQHERRTDHEARIVTMTVPTWGELLVRGWYVGRMWWLWFWIRCVPNVFWFFAYPFVDKRGEGLSLTRFMAISFVVLIFHVVESNGVHTISANTLWLALACFAVAFGKSTFTFLLSRMEMKAQNQTVETITTDTAKVIEAVRSRRTDAASEGAEATR